MGICYFFLCPEVKVWIVNAVPDPDLEIKNGGLGGRGGGWSSRPGDNRGSRPPQTPPLDLPLPYKVLAVGVAKT